MSSQAKKVLVSWPEPIDLSVLHAAMPDAEFTFCPLDDPAICEALPETEIWVAGGPPVSDEQLDAAKKLKWIQMFGAGLPPGVFQKRFRERGFLLSNAKGVNIDNMAEHALMFILAFARGLPTLVRRQARHEWILQTHAPTLFELGTQTLGIVGYGAIGSAVARRARALGMKVWAVRRSPSDSDIGEVDRMLGREDLPELLASVDHVLLSVPLTPDTEGMMGADQFALMKPTAYFHNIGRGKLVDQDALLAALVDGRIAGAGLDVVTPEPLPADHPLWDAPNTLITGHLAGNTPEFFPRVMAYIAKNMRRYMAGEELAGRVDLSRGY
ncbi:D-2-hydroxyacid dehydrogenase [Parasphingopyxis algicola]|uniref:D-2-hydroxyacid dehydrogenase n=1 Tax=Parasphingopyxis algicola TaxID=2026624 RepID=UPI0015A33062|nr:D-2-hydroxyacid dehydrogenase [Parasphingopyxis algicola]QLC26405.1 D-2-hydroxyacid dehydrogenase [Parasphingopyxis algicola]